MVLVDNFENILNWLKDSIKNKLCLEDLVVKYGSFNIKFFFKII